MQAGDTRRSDRTPRVLTALAASLTLAALVAVLVFLLGDSWPSLLYNGLTFVTGTTWNIGNLYAPAPVTVHGVKAMPGATFGALVFLAGTLLTSILALVLAVPTAVGIALFLTEYAPAPLGRTVSFVVELLAGVPSVVYGLWGIIVLVPWIGSTLGPGMARVLGFVPFLRGPVGTGAGLLASGVVLALMVVPIIATTVREALLMVPAELKAGAMALGMTRWEAIRAVSLPFARHGIFGASILGLGRALGETMAVLMVSGDAMNLLPQSLYAPVSTLAATIASQLDSALTDASGMAVHALAEMALLLFLITVVVNVLARLMVRRRPVRGT